jgi:hypothetical protein
MRGTHQGQQSARTAPTGRTHDCKRPLHHAPHDLLHGGGHPHMTTRTLAVGRTAAKTGLNTPPGFGRDIAAGIAELTSYPFITAPTP